jgi:hypothetical protein
VSRRQSGIGDASFFGPRQPLQSERYVQNDRSSLRHASIGLVVGLAAASIVLVTVLAVVAGRADDDRKEHGVLDKRLAELIGRPLMRPSIPEHATFRCWIRPRASLRDAHLVSGHMAP